MRNFVIIKVFIFVSIVLICAIIGAIVDINKHYTQNTVIITAYSTLIDPFQGICVYKGINLAGDSVDIELRCCAYGIGDTVTNKEKFFKIREHEGNKEREK